MPDTTAMVKSSYPTELHLASDIEKFYRKQLPQNLKTIFDSFGTEAKTEPPTLSDSHRLHVESDQVAKWGQSFENYQTVLTRLNEATRNLVRIDADIVPLARKTAEISEQAQLTINQVVETINVKAADVPPPTMREDEWVMTYLADATETATAALETARIGYQDPAGDAGTMKTDMEKIREGIDGSLKSLAANDDALKKSLDTLAAQNGAAGNQDVPGAGSGGVQANGPTGPATGNQNLGYQPINPAALTGLNGPGSTPSDRTDPTRTDPTRTDPTRIASDLARNTIDSARTATDPVRSVTDPARISTDPTRTANDAARSAELAQRAATPPTTVTPVSSPMSSGGGGMDMSSSMLPVLMSMMANQRNLADNGQLSRPRDIDENRYGRTPQPVSPVQSTPGPVTPQAPATVTAPGGAPPASPQPGQNAGDGPKQPGVAQGPAHTPDADGNVMYPFPDGKNQLVSALVAQALDAAFNDSNAADARQAYAKTAAKWDSGDKLTEISPSMLTTGDVCTWKNPDHSAIVRASGSGDDGVLEIIVDGKLVPIENEMTSGAGSFGEFAGFVRPRGVAPAVAGKQTGGDVGGVQAPGDTVLASI